MRRYTEAEEPTPHLSCAEMLMAGSQSLLVNDWMAAVIGQYLYKLLHHQPITTFLTFINTDDLAIQSKCVGREELLMVLDNT